jgi:hypothetical protein
MCQIGKLISLSSRGLDLPALADEPVVHQWAGFAGAGGGTMVPQADEEHARCRPWGRRF